MSFGLYSATEASPKVGREGAPEGWRLDPKWSSAQAPRSVLRVAFYLQGADRGPRDWEWDHSREASVSQPVHEGGRESGVWGGSQLGHHQVDGQLCVELGCHFVQEDWKRTSDDRRWARGEELGQPCHWDASKVFWLGWAEGPILLGESSWRGGHPKRVGLTVFLLAIDRQADGQCSLKALQLLISP